MRETIDFRQGLDTGEVDPQAIAPIRNGEPAEQSVLNRPSEVLRLRTEVLRAEANENRWLRDADRAVYVWARSASLQWGGAYLTGSPAGSGVLSLGTTASSLTLTSLWGPGVTRGETWSSTGTTFASRLARLEASDADGRHTVRFVSRRFQFQGANSTSVEIQPVTGSGPVAVVVTGNPTVADASTQPGFDDIRVTYDPLMSHTVDDILDAVNAHPAASELVLAQYAEAQPTLYPDSDLAFPVVRQYLTGGFDGVFHELRSGVLSDFFAASPANLLREGDTLAVWYDDVTLRRQSLEENENKHLVAVGNLVNLSREPEKAANAIPIGRVLSDAFVFASGFVLQRGVVAQDLTQPHLPVTGWSVPPGTNKLETLLTTLDGRITGADDRITDVDADLRALISAGGSGSSAALLAHVHDGAAGSPSKVDLRNHTTTGSTATSIAGAASGGGFGDTTSVYTLSHTPASPSWRAGLSASVLQADSYARISEIRLPYNTPLVVKALPSSGTTTSSVASSELQAGSLTASTLLTAPEVKLGTPTAGVALVATTLSGTEIPEISFSPYSATATSTLVTRFGTVLATFAENSVGFFDEQGLAATLTVDTAAVKKLQASDGIVEIRGNTGGDATLDVDTVKVSELRAQSALIDVRSSSGNDSAVLAVNTVTAGTLEADTCYAGIARLNRALNTTIPYAESRVVVSGELKSSNTPDAVTGASPPVQPNTFKSLPVVRFHDASNAPVPIAAAEVLATNAPIAVGTFDANAGEFVTAGATNNATFYGFAKTVFWNNADKRFELFVKKPLYTSDEFNYNLGRITVLVTKSNVFGTTSNVNPLDATFSLVAEVRGNVSGSTVGGSAGTTGWLEIWIHSFKLRASTTGHGVESDLVAVPAKYEGRISVAVYAPGGNFVNPDTGAYAS